jgi:hypothetical protein
VTRPAGVDPSRIDVSAAGAGGGAGGGGGFAGGRGSGGRGGDGGAGDGSANSHDGPQGEPGMDGTGGRGGGAGADSTGTGANGTITITVRGGIDDAGFFVRQQYLDFLGREPDAGGLAFWTGQIARCGDDGACVQRARTDVSLAFWYSAEFVQAHPGLRNPAGVTPDFVNSEFVRLSYVTYLRRAPDPGGFGFWLGQLDRGNDYPALVTAFLQSGEYRGRFGSP